MWQSHHSRASPMSDELTLLPKFTDTMERLESLRKEQPSGVEYWLAREIAPVLGYETWRRFEDVIGRAIDACVKSGVDPAKHFAETDKMVALGSDAKRGITDFFLSRAACYLIAMNGESSKPEI